VNNYFYSSFESPFDSFTIVWKEEDSKPQIMRIYLSDPEVKSDTKALKEYNQMKRASTPSSEQLASKIQKFLNGKSIIFELELLDFSFCFETQKKVLLAEYAIPRGWISTYKRIANKIGIPKGARVVGNALARNPFPLVIPCHRAIKSNGELGGFQGGVKMKRALLELEGIEFSTKGKVIMNKVHY
jgi:methylated-DNA-[protein]-cysteine S-methyltransferase